MRPLWSWRLPAPLLLLLSSLSLILPPGAESCTCFIVTAGASETGAAQVSYAADSHTLYGYLQVRTWARRPPLVSISLGWACQDVCAALTLGSLSSSGGVFVRACIQIKYQTHDALPLSLYTQFFPRSIHSDGDKINVTDWDSGEYRGVIDQVGPSVFFPTHTRPSFVWHYLIFGVSVDRRPLVLSLSNPSLRCL